jgi:hypothetical protein
MKTTILAGALVLAASGVHAATLSFNGGTPLTSGSYNTPQSTLIFDDGTVTVEVSGQRVQNGVLISGQDDVAAYWGSNGGLGVCTSGAQNGSVGRCDDVGRNRDDHQIDGDNSGNGADEMAVLDFGDQIVTIVSATFSRFGSNDDFDFAMYSDDFDRSNGQSPTTYFSDIDPSGIGVVTYNFIGTYTGSVFGFGADGSDDEFKLQAVEYTISEVPLPASALLLLGSLAGFAGLRRKKAS